jgi:hypothetical protein
MELGDTFQKACLKVLINFVGTRVRGWVDGRKVRTCFCNPANVAPAQPVQYFQSLSVVHCHPFFLSMFTTPQNTHSVSPLPYHPPVNTDVPDDE